MATDIRVPALGESVTEATIGQWFKKVGDTVAADEPVVELETDKVTIEVPAPSAGVLQAISANPGDTVNVGALIGAIGEGAAAPAPKAPEPPKPAAATAAPAAPAFKPEPAPPAPGNGGAAPAPAPSAQKLIAENGLSAGDINGSGRHGQVLKEDVLAAMSRPAAPAAAPAQSAVSGSAAVAPRPAPAPVAAPAPAPAPVPRAPVAVADESREERVKMTRLRATIARRLKDAQNTAAMLTTFNEVDMKPVMDLRAQYKDLFEKKHGVKLGFMGFFTKAVTHALKEIPA
ncbi:MAG: 2-oxo acid dehydrogenase subunit E2, partial [Devosia sp.]|nr:2-oxo acid dehydrogenase subunit E2 [Devosia sp.]